MNKNYLFQFEIVLTTLSSFLAINSKHEFYSFFVGNLLRFIAVSSKV